MGNLVYYKCGKLIFNSKMYENRYLVVENNRIKSMLELDILVPKEATIVDYLDYMVAPGFVDTHIHGMAGHDVMDGTFEAVNEISKALLYQGVTSFVPTTLTASVDTLNNTVKIIGDNVDKFEGARVEGIFLEGPFFTEKYKGAQNADYFIEPCIDVLKKWQELSSGNILKVAVAPELEAAKNFTKQAKQMGIYVAIGHSSASYEQAMKILNAGANIFVHTFNGMSPFNHRDPGMVGAALLSNDDVYCEIIADGLHTNPMAAKLLFKAKGSSNMVLVTDCMMAGGMPEGEYKLGEYKVLVADGAARLEAGNLAGSILELHVAVKNIVKWKFANVLEAINMATLAPAKSLGLDDRCGVLRLGRLADFNILDDKLNVIETYLGGVRIEK